jgi:hypothetical protein
MAQYTIAATSLNLPVTQLGPFCATIRPPLAGPEVIPILYACAFAADPREAPLRDIIKLPLPENIPIWQVKWGCFGRYLGLGYQKLDA